VLYFWPLNSRGMLLRCASLHLRAGWRVPSMWTCSSILGRAEMNGDILSSDIVSLRMLYNVATSYQVTTEKGYGHLAESNRKPPTSGLLSRRKTMTNGHQQHEPLQSDDLS
jgi:hypothetical protein